MLLAEITNYYLLPMASSRENSFVSKMCFCQHFTNSFHAAIKFFSHGSFLLGGTIQEFLVISLCFGFKSPGHFASQYGYGCYR